MIRQSQNRGESKKDRRSDIDERKCQAPDTQETLTEIFDEEDDLDPADFFDPEDLRP
jgi:hypothetical protein